MSEFNFNPEQSHRWAEHFRAWRSHLGTTDNSIEEICYDTRTLPTDREGVHYAPLMTAMVYAFGMQRKMQLECCMVAETLDEDDDISEMVADDTDKVMGLFVDDIEQILRVQKAGSMLQDILEDINDENGVHYDELSFNGPRMPNEWRHIFDSVPQSSNIQLLMQMYVRGRMAQEYWTLLGAVEIFHQVVHGAGAEAVRDVMRENAPDLALVITQELDTIRQYAALKDGKGMRTDHRIVRSNGAVVPFFWREATTNFLNCPVAESYKVVDRVLGEKYGHDGVLTNGESYFCGLCQAHGKEAVNRFVPGFVAVKDYGSSRIVLMV